MWPNVVIVLERKRERGSRQTADELTKATIKVLIDLDDIMHHNHCIKSTQRSFVLTKGAFLWVIVLFMPFYFGYQCSSINV